MLRNARLCPVAWCGLTIAGAKIFLRSQHDQPQGPTLRHGSHGSTTNGHSSSSLLVVVLQVLALALVVGEAAGRDFAANRQIHWRGPRLNMCQSGGAVFRDWGHAKPKRGAQAK